jgi:hypothetical protein
MLQHYLFKQDVKIFFCCGNAVSIEQLPAPKNPYAYIGIAYVYR